MTTPSTDEHIDALARELGPLTGPPEEDADLALLLAWRAGALESDEDVARAEAILAADPAARAFVDDLDAQPSEVQVARWVKAAGADRGASTGGGGGEVVPLRRRWLGPAVTLLAMAAAVVIFVSRPPAPIPDPPAFSVSHHRGAHALTRSAGDTAPAKVYTVDDAATVSFTLSPARPPGEALHARAFVDDPDGALLPIEPQGAMGDGGAWTLEAPTRALFGARYGERALHVAFSADPDRLEGLAGTRPSAADDDGVGWHTLHIVYRREGEGAR